MAKQTGRSQRQRSSDATPETPVEETSLPGGPPLSDESSGSPENPLGVEPVDWIAPEDGEQPPVARASDLELEDDYEAASPELLEWTPERAEAIVRGGGFLLHTLDPLATADHGPDGAELWRATEQDARDMSAPLARILNRYAPARRLAGVSDEVELGLGFVAYAKRNLAARGRIAAAVKRAEDDRPGPFEGAIAEEGRIDPTGNGLDEFGGVA